MVALVALGLLSQLVLRATVADYFVASRGLGSVMLLMSLIGTTMTAFALIGSSGEAWESGIVVYGKMASWSGIIHAAMYFLVGIKLWAFGKKYGYVTQIQFFRDRFESDKLGLLLFPILVALLIPYVLLGVISSGTAIQQVTVGAFPTFFTSTDPKLVGAIPYWLGSLVTCIVVLYYISAGGVRGTAWVNALQTVIFLILGFAACYTISEKLGGPLNATKMVMEYNPTRLKRDVTADDMKIYEEKLAAFNAKQSVIKPREPHAASKVEFATYMFIPLSVAMFPHLFQYWLTARSAKKFRLSIIGQPLLIMVIWAPCVMIGIWATSAIMENGQAVIPPDFARPNGVLPLIVKKLASPALGAFLAAGIFAAVMSSMDAQFLALGSMFTNDFVAHYARKDRFTEKQLVFIGRLFIVLVVGVSYFLALAWRDSRVFNLGVWCFAGFASLFPILFAAIYWRRVTKAGVYASIIAAAVVWLYLFRESQFGKSAEPLHYGLTPVTFIFAAATIALVLVSLVTRAPSEATLSKFFTSSVAPNERWGRGAGG